MLHELDIHPKYFKAIIEERKTHEIRKNDRNFKVGDFLYLREWNPKTQRYTGKYRWVLVKYVDKLNMTDYSIFESDYVAMSISILKLK